MDESFTKENSHLESLRSEMRVLHELALERALGIRDKMGELEHRLPDLVSKTIEAKLNQERPASAAPVQAHDFFGKPGNPEGKTEAGQAASTPLGNLEELIARVVDSRLSVSPSGTSPQPPGHGFFESPANAEMTLEDLERSLPDLIARVVDEKLKQAPQMRRVESRPAAPNYARVLANLEMRLPQLVGDVIDAKLKDFQRLIAPPRNDPYQYRPGSRSIRALAPQTAPSRPRVSYQYPGDVATVIPHPPVRRPVDPSANVPPASDAGLKRTELQVTRVLRQVEAACTGRSPGTAEIIRDIAPPLDNGPSYGRCPKCMFGHLRRATRRSYLEETFRFVIAPYRCQVCSFRTISLRPGLLERLLIGLR